MPNCTVFWCKKRSGTSSLKKDNTTFHLYPKEPTIRAAWVKASGNHISWTPKRTSTICSQHFETSCFIEQSNNKRKLIKNAIPTLKLSKVDCSSDSVCEPGQPSFKIREATFDDPQPQQTQECRTSRVKLSEHNITVLKTIRNPKPEVISRQIQLRRCIQIRNKKIKRLQSQQRYLMKKAAKLQKLLKFVTETYF